MRDIGAPAALVDALKADTLSLTAWQVGMYGWMAIVTFAIFGHEPAKTGPVFWFMMQIAMLAGLGTAFPVKAWLLRVGGPCATSFPSTTNTGSRVMRKFAVASRCVDASIQCAVFAALSVLVMGYPCTVGISAPLSIVRGSADAAGRGILMRTGEAFEGLRRVTTVVFDKTGTLTEGKPVLREIVPHAVTEAALVAIAAAVESASEHPLAQAVVQRVSRSGT